MKLLKYRVTNFRSVDDSGWIDASDVTALIGTNESGKTNLILPLWKLNPAGTEGAIDLLADAPRKKYNEYRAGNKTITFIEAHFQLSAGVAEEIASVVGATAEDVCVVSISRQYNGKHLIGFPEDTPRRSMPSSALLPLLQAAKKDIDAIAPMKTEEIFKTQIGSAIDSAISQIDNVETVEVATVRGIKATLAVDVQSSPARSTAVPRLGQLQESIEALLQTLSRPLAKDVEEARDIALAALPKFVYYSNYGNLDSEIYLPHVIANMKRKGLGSREAAKARTLKVLFDFVRLSPQEVLELGEEVNTDGEPTAADIAAVTKRKKERDVLFQSASAELTGKFRDWWKQGTYQFRLAADGDHFRIWVADDKRPEYIELEGRSTGLQWFLSFYLIFLVESKEAHQGAILLLDEPGLSLHPIAQRDLSQFFESLSRSNQILYTTHSPFLVDSNHLDRVKAVFVQADGTTGVSSDLRVGEKELAQSRSVYPVYAALGLSIADILLPGAQSVIVEGTSDQFYLSAIKVLLISAGRLTPSRELLFVPAGGARAIKAIAGVLAGKDERLPVVLLDGDPAGIQAATDLRSSLYGGDKERVLVLNTIPGITSLEIEDAMPRDIIVQALDRYLRGPDETFSEKHDPNIEVVPQVKAYATRHGLTLEAGWKPEVARLVKARLLRGGASAVSTNQLDTWSTLLGALLVAGEPTE